MAKRTRFIDELMNEPIHLNGCPQIIVTRGWALQFFLKLGFKMNTGSFSSADYMAFRQKPTTEPLSDLSEPWIVNVLKRMEADCAH